MEKTEFLNAVLAIGPCAAIAFGLAIGTAWSEIDDAMKRRKRRKRARTHE